MFCFWILRNFGGNRKRRKTGKILANRAPTLQRREPTPRRRPTPRHGNPRHGEAGEPKLAPLRYATA